MKRRIALLVWILIAGFQISIYAQTAVEIEGTIRSQHGAVQAAIITFSTINNELLGTCVSGTDGKFKSEYKMQVGRTIRIKVSKPEYSSAEKTYIIDRTGNAGDFMLRPVTLTVSGFVLDSITKTPLDKAEVFFYEASKLIQERHTNSLGYFDIETGFTYGQKITIQISMSGYHTAEQTITFTSEGINRVPDFLLAKIGSRALRAVIVVVDKKKRKPLPGARIQYLDRRLSEYVDTAVSSKGKLELKLYQQPGTKLEMEISNINYKTRKADPILSTDLADNVFTYELKRDRNILPPLLLAGGGALAFVSAGMFISSNSKYESYKDFSNINRENDYDIAQRRQNISIATGVAATGCLIGYAIYKSNVKKKEEARAQDKKRTGFKLFVPSDLAGVNDNRRIGLAYRF